jgi:O-antigen/teichoic acid export membrane protein
MSLIKRGIQWTKQGSTPAAATVQTVLTRLAILGINLATGIMTARILSPTGRGEQAAILLWPSFLVSMMTFGLHNALVFNLNRYPEKRDRLFAAILVLCSAASLLAMAVGIVFIPQWLAQYPPEIVHLAQIFMINAPLMTLGIVCFLTIESMDDFWMPNQARFISNLSTLVLLILFFATNTFNVFTASFAYVFANIPILIWMLVYICKSKQLRPKFAGLYESCQLLLNYGLRAYIGESAGALSMQLDQLLVVSLLSSDLVGTYAVALSISRMLGLLQGSVATVLFPKASSKSLDEVVEMTTSSARLALYLSGFAGLAAILVMPWLLELLYGKAYLGAIDVFRILITETVLSGTVVILIQAFMAFDKPIILTVVQLVGLGISAPLMMILISKYSLIGAAIAVLCSTSAKLICVMACYPAILKFKVPRLWLNRSDLLGLQRRVANIRFS